MEPENADKQKCADAANRSMTSRALTLGIELATGMAVFTLIGYWLDSRRGGGQSWTLCGMGMGLVYVAYQFWRLIRGLNSQPRDKAESSKGTDRDRSGQAD